MTGLYSHTSLHQARAFHDAILLFQRRMRRARLDYSLPVDGTSSLILTVLSTNETLTPGALAQALSLAPSTISRVLANLGKRKYITTSSSPSDGRSKQISFTASGRSLFEHIGAVSNEVSLRGTYPLSSDQRIHMRDVLASFNDGLEIPAVQARPGELPLMCQQRRLARGTGMLVGADYMGLGLGLETYHILHELSRSQEPVRFNELCRSLPIHPSTVSRTLDRLRQKRMVSKTTPSGDGRGLAVTLTKTGTDYFNALATRIAQRYAGALKKVDRSQAALFIELMEQLKDIPIPATIKQHIACTLCRSDEELFSARKTLIQLLVANNRHHRLPATLVGPQDSAVLLRHGEDDPCAILVFSQRGELQYFECAPSTGVQLQSQSPSSAESRPVTLFKRGAAEYLRGSGATTLAVPKALATQLNVPLLISAADLTGSES